MRSRRVSLTSLSALVLVLAASWTVAAGESRADGSPKQARAKVVRVGAVAYSPAAVTIFEDIRRYFDRQGMPLDYVLYSNYDALVEALRKGDVDIAWNSPLAHARYHRKAGNASQALVMRDVDCNFRSMVVVRADANIRTLDDLKGKTLILGSSQAAEATVLPIHFLRREGFSLGRVKVHSLDGLVDLRGNPCSSEVHVLKALRDGRGQAGVIGERLWKHLSQHQPDQVSGLRALWVSPPFSHCVFTASKDFDKGLAARFTRLMLAMDPNDPLTAEAMRLEGTRKWVAGSQEGFQELFKILPVESECCSEECCSEECCSEECCSEGSAK
jgi:ABC-type phosphate/phosphonate transport system substrate-binding protein